MNNEDFEKAMADFLAKGGVIRCGSRRAYVPHGILRRR
jgi:hypothetical protein